MTTFSDTWNDSFEASPDDDNYGYEIDNYIRKLALAIRERMEVEHKGKDGVNDGAHSTVVVDDHGLASAHQVVNVCYGTGDPPTASDTTLGTLFIKYTA